MRTHAVPKFQLGMCPLTRMRADAYTARHAHKRVLNKLYRELTQRQKPARWKGRWCKGNDWDLEARLALVLDDITIPLHGQTAEPFRRDAARIQVELKPAESTSEKYELFRKYQIAIHKESPDEQDRDSWERFLVESPFPRARGYGTFHQEYRCASLLTDHGRLIAIGVLDILPHCVSSVYLYYDPEFAHWELGTVSALREIALTRQLQRRDSNITHYYLGALTLTGFYIDTCQKMRYKAGYRPPELLDTSSNIWVPFDAYKHRTGAVDITTACRAARMGTLPAPAPPGFASPQDVEHNVPSAACIYGGALVEGGIPQLLVRNN